MAAKSLDITALDITDRIERIDSCEKRFDIRLEALSAFLKDEYGDRQISVCGEIHLAVGTEISCDITLAFAAYDSNGRLIGLEEKSFDAEKFFAFDLFDIKFSVPKFSVPKCKIEKLRIFPKKC